MTGKIKGRTVYVLTRKNKADDDDTDIYVGSTSLPLEQRLYCHRKDAKLLVNRNNKLYKRMYGVVLQNWEILPLLGRICGKKEAFELEKNGLGYSGPALTHIYQLQIRLTGKRTYNVWQNIVKKTKKRNGFTVVSVTLQLRINLT